MGSVLARKSNASPWTEHGRRVVRGGAADRAPVCRMHRDPLSFRGGERMVRSSNRRKDAGFRDGRLFRGAGGHRAGDGRWARRGGEPARRAQGTRPARTGRPFRLIPLNTGECQLGKDHVLGEPYTSDERIAFTIYAFLADGGPGRRVLIDLGPVGLEYINAMFRRFKFFRELPGDPDAIRQRRGTCSTGSSGWGWAADIDHIV